MTERRPPPPRVLDHARSLTMSVPTNAICRHNRTSARRSMPSCAIFTRNIACEVAGPPPFGNRESFRRTRLRCRPDIPCRHGRSLADTCRQGTAEAFPGRPRTMRRNQGWSRYQFLDAVASSTVRPERLASGFQPTHSRLRVGRPAADRQPRDGRRAGRRPQSSARSTSVRSMRPVRAAAMPTICSVGRCAACLDAALRPLAHRDPATANEVLRHAGPARIEVRHSNAPGECRHRRAGAASGRQTGYDPTR